MSVRLYVYVRVRIKYRENCGFGCENRGIVRTLELFTRKVCEMFIYKHTKTI